MSVGKYSSHAANHSRDQISLSLFISVSQLCIFFIPCLVHITSYSERSRSPRHFHQPLRDTLRTKIRQCSREVESTLVTSRLLQRVRVYSSVVLQFGGFRIVKFLLAPILLLELLPLLRSSVLGENFPNTPPCRVQCPCDPGVMAAGSFTREMKVSVCSGFGDFQI